MLLALTAHSLGLVSGAAATLDRKSIDVIDDSCDDPSQTVIEQPPPTLVTIGTPVSTGTKTSESACFSVSTGTGTWYAGFTNPATAIPTYATTVEIDTFLYPCQTSYPMTVVQVQTMIAKFVPEASKTDFSTVETYTWGHFAAAPTSAGDQYTNISCGECPGAGWKPDPRCQKRNYHTGCGIQCGLYKDHFVCLQNSTRAHDFREGRICWDGESKDVVYLGEPCQKGDNMAYCEPCSEVSNPRLSS
jgi:hypothetical protein